MKRVFTIGGQSHGKKPVFFRWQSKQGNLLATAARSDDLKSSSSVTTNKVVNIWSRHGEIIDEIDLQGNCTALEWSMDGVVLAIAQDSNTSITLFNANTQQKTTIETGFRNDLITFCSWSSTSILAVGTKKGNLMMYNHKVAKKQVFLGKHSRRISCGLWSPHNTLGLGSQDKSISISQVNGEIADSCEVRDEPNEIRFSPLMQASTSSANGAATVSAILNNKTLYLHKINSEEPPTELAFQPKYGHIVTHEWFGESYIMIGFSKGYSIVISTLEAGKEIYQFKNHKNCLNDIAVSTVLDKAATCGDNIIKIHELSDPRDIYAIIPIEEHSDKGELDSLRWTDDGQLLSISTLTGEIYTYLTKLPVIGSAHGTRLAHLTSLQEITISNKINGENPVKLQVDLEPSFVAVGPIHVACGMNSLVWFYATSEPGAPPELVSSRDGKEYLGTVLDISLNSDYAAVLHEPGKVQLHMIELSPDMGGDESRYSKMFPEDESSGIIKCCALTPLFCIFGTDQGTLEYFCLEGWSSIDRFTHVCPITAVFPDSSGTRVVFSDQKGDAFLYNPVNGANISIPDFPTNATGVLWDQWSGDMGVFVAFNETSLHTYFYRRHSLNGAGVDFVTTSELPAGMNPLMLYNGVLSCQTASGKTDHLVPDSHKHVKSTLKEDEYKGAIKDNMAIGRYQDAFRAARLLNNRDDSLNVMRDSLAALDIDTAIHAAREAGDAQMVSALQKLTYIEDHSLLAGHAALLLKRYSLAQDHFLASSEPRQALEMQRDRMQWESALKLANRLAPDQIPFISCQYAQQLELTGEYSKARDMYERGILASDEGNAKHNTACREGLARMEIRTGEVRKGIQSAIAIGSKNLFKDCGSILESLNQLNEAADMFEKAHCLERACAVYTRVKNWSKAGELLKEVSMPSLHAQYAKAKEAEGSYKEAADSYLLARDYNSVVRIQLDMLNNVDEAVRIVNESKSQEGAKLVANFFKKHCDYTAAIKFLVLSACTSEAFNLAQSQDKMEIYAEAIGESATKEEYTSMALHFEKHKQNLLAGKYFMKAADYPKAMKLLLLCNVNDGENIELAIETVGLASESVGDSKEAHSLTAELINYLVGDVDGIEKDSHYLFRLYMAIKQYREAARTAIIIAREEQNGGNYRNAHDVLLRMYQELRKQGEKVPQEMTLNLTMLHSYLVAKVQIKRGDHLRGARLLNRVSNNISKFPSHMVAILTSTVIECYRAGMRNSAFSWAAMLMRREYKTKIDPKFKRKMEQIVRKPDKSEIEEIETACPFCGNLVSECSACNNALPFCLASGKHLSDKNWTCCPKCSFPAIVDELKLLADESDTISCPMCTENIEMSELRPIT
eukprot:UC4_evm1s724